MDKEDQLKLLRPCFVALLALACAPVFAQGYHPIANPLPIGGYVPGPCPPEYYPEPLPAPDPDLYPLRFPVTPSEPPCPLPVLSPDLLPPAPVPDPAYATPPPPVLRPGYPGVPDYIRHILGG